MPHAPSDARAHIVGRERFKVERAQQGVHRVVYIGEGIEQRAVEVEYEKIVAHEENTP